MWSSSIGSMRIRGYALGVRRVTVSLDDDLVKIAEADVSAGRAKSVSAWVASAMRAKAQARAELVSDMRELEARDATSDREMARIADSLGLPATTVRAAMNGGASRTLPQRRRRRR